MTGEEARDAERGPHGGDDRDDRGGEVSPVPADEPATTGRRGLLRRPGRGPGRKERAAARAEQDGGRVRAFAGAVADRLIATAPRIPVRSLATLRAQFPGQGPEEIADRLISAAAKGSATVGAGVGAAAMLPVPPAMPAELTAEVVGVASVELKLIAELHEVYGLRPPGNARQRGLAYLQAWTHERGIDPVAPTTLNAALGVQLRRELRQRLLKRTLRNLPNLTPLMIGAVVGAVMNRRDTTRLAGRVRDDLRGRQVPWSRLPPGDQPALDADSTDTSR
ncbi:hypothetical protein V1J52_00455 [Streptomyces sp. TRM 70351]|uniref:hypothetical protein n=1 Tax=Streptomyces sp. TRM 70351 TaxID=3116552 RepID=UPI002E7C05E2|nr:hypothetical protein [Streptomyces sp. TRM 70351]MEE1926667.1 hypothetical protein [Streptomyces sp. TRM 70351]